jgi:hypothetical protein
MSNEQDQTNTPPEQPAQSEQPVPPPENTVEQVDQTPEKGESDHQPWPGLPPHEPSANVVQEYEIYNQDHSAGPAALENGELLIIPADTEKRVEQYHEQRPNELIGDTEGERIWAQKLLDGEMTRATESQFQASVEREDSKWYQGIASENSKLMAARPRFSAPGEPVTGQRAVQRVRALLGMGMYIQIPMWASGFWITLRAPTEGDLLDLFRRISDEKVTLGRRTYGLAFANSSSFIAAQLVQFAEEHMHDKTLKPSLDWRKCLKTSDLQTLAWGLACVIFPKGFQYSRSVLVGENQEKKEVKGLLDVSKMNFVDRSRLTEWQIAHMSRRMGNHTTEELLERYQAEFTLRERRVTLEQGLDMTLQVPSIDEYLKAGSRWIDSITDMVDRSFQQPVNDEIRDRYISTQGKATVMRQFVHWVKNFIEVGSDGTEAVIDDTETLDMLMNTLSEVDEVRKAYFAAIHKFVDDTTISVIATTAAAPSEENKLPRYPHLVPIDSLYTFFTLLVQKNNRIQARMAL